MKKIIVIIFCFIHLNGFAQTNFVYGVNVGISISSAQFNNQNDIAGLKILKSSFIHFDISADWYLNKKFRFGVGLGLDEYKDVYQFDKLKYLSVNHPDILAGMTGISSTYTITNVFPVQSFNFLLAYQFYEQPKLSILPYVNFKFNYCRLNTDSLASQKNRNSSIYNGFAFDTWLYSPNEFIFSTIIGTKLRLNISKKHLLQFGLGYEILTKNLKEGNLRIYYVNKDSEESVRYRGNNINISVGLLRYKYKKEKKVID